MKYDVDAAQLVQLLSRAPDATNDDSETVNPYLLDSVYWPLINGAALSVHAVSYDEFDADDILGLIQWYEFHKNETEKTTAVCRQLKKLDAVCVMRRQFC